MLRLMGSKTVGILIRSVKDDGVTAAIDRLVAFAAEHSGVLPEDLVEISVEPIDIEENAETAERFFDTLLGSPIRLLYVGDLNLYFKTKTEAYAALQLLEGAGFEVLREPQTAKARREEHNACNLVGTVLSLEKKFRQARLQFAREKNKKLGGVHGGNPPYGALQGEHTILEGIRRDKAAGLGHTEIASRLNAEMVKPRRGQKWYPAVIANIVGVRREAKKRASLRSAKKSE